MTAEAALTLRTEDVTESDWRRQFERVPRTNLFQSWEFGEAMRRAEGQAPLRAYLYAKGLHIGLVQGFRVRRLGVFSFVRVLRGPLFFQPTPPDIHAIAVQHIRKAHPLARLTWSTVMPEIAEAEVWDKATAARGLNRVMDGYETAWLDLRRSADSLRAGLKQKWRNQLAKAEEAGLSIEPSEETGWLLEKYEQQRRQRRYAGPSAALIGALPPETAFTLIAKRNGSPVAGVHFLLHGPDATYQVGWSGEDGRAANAHNLLLWQGVLTLKKRGVRWLDLGGLDAEKMPGIAHFKQGLGGEAFRCAGVYL